jgi:integrase
MTEELVLEYWTKYAKNRTLGTPPYSPKEDAKMAEARLAEAKQNTISSIFEDCLKIKVVSVKPKRIAQMRSFMRIWIDPIIGDVPISDLKAKHVAEVLMVLQKGDPPANRQGAKDDHIYVKGPRSPQTQKHVFNVIRTLWAYAEDAGLVAGKFPGRKIRIDFDNERQFFFTHEQAAAVLNDLRKEGSALKGKKGGSGSLDAWGMALISLQCGLRAGEILSLTWSDIAEQTIYETKNRKKSRRFYITPDVRDMLDERKHLSKYTKPTDYVFPRMDGKRLVQPGRVFERCFSRLGINTPAEKNNAKKAVFHSFRHTFATWLAMKGVPMVVLATLLGHSVTKTTERYVKHAPQTVEAIAAQQIGSMADVLLGLRPKPRQGHDISFTETSREQVTLKQH